MQSNRVRIFVVAAVVILALVLILGRDSHGPMPAAGQLEEQGAGAPIDRSAAANADSPQAITSRDRAMDRARAGALAPRTNGANANLTVRVRTRDGEPAIAALVSVVDVADPDRLDLFLSETEHPTDGNGEVRLRHLPPGDYLVSCKVTSWQHVQLAAGEHREIELTVLTDIRLSGRVVDTHGQGIADAEILVGSDDGARCFVVGRSDAEGRYRVSLGGLTANLFARKSGFTASANYTYVLGEHSLDFVLEAAMGGLRGVVRDPAGRAIAGVRLRAQVRLPANSPTNFRASDEEPLRWPSTRSLADGSFAFEGLPLGAVSIHADVAGFAPSTMDVVIEDQHSSTTEIMLKRGASLRGRVRWNDGPAVPGAKVTVELPELHGPLRTRADDLGEFEVVGLPLGQVKVVVRHPLAGDSVATADAEVRSLDESIETAVRLRRTVLQHGVVVDERGEGLASLVVVGYHENGSSTALTDREGRFQLRLHPNEAASVEVYASLSGELLTLASLTQVTPDGQELRIVVPDAARPSAQLHSIVQRPPHYENEPVVVILEGDDGKFHRLAAVDATGRLRIQSLAPGRYVLRTHGMRSRFHGDLLAKFTLAAEQTLDLGTIALPAPVVLEFVVRTTHGREITDIEGSLLAVPTREKICDCGLMNGHSFWTPPLAEGEYIVQFPDGDGYVGAELDVSLRRGPPNRIDVVLEPLQRVRVELAVTGDAVLPESLPFEILDARGNSRPAGSHGRQLAFSLRPGAHRVRVAAPGWSGEIALDAIAEREEIVRVRMELRRMR